MRSPMRWVGALTVGTLLLTAVAQAQPVKGRSGSDAGDAGARIDALQTDLVRELRENLNAAAESINTIEWIRRQLLDLQALAGDLGGDAAVSVEGVVIRNGAVIVEAHYLAEIAGHVLGRIELLPIARRYEQVPLVVE